MQLQSHSQTKLAYDNETRGRGSGGSFGLSEVLGLSASLSLRNCADVRVSDAD